MSTWGPGAGWEPRRAGAGARTVMEARVPTVSRAWTRPKGSFRSRHCFTMRRYRGSNTFRMREQPGKSTDCSRNKGRSRAWVSLTDRYRWVGGCRPSVQCRGTKSCRVRAWSKEKLPSHEDPKRQQAKRPASSAERVWSPNTASPRARGTVASPPSAPPSGPGAGVSAPPSARMRGGRRAGSTARAYAAST